MDDKLRVSERLDFEKEKRGKGGRGGKGVKGGGFGPGNLGMGSRLLWSYQMLERWVVGSFVGLVLSQHSAGTDTALVTVLCRTAVSDCVVWLGLRRDIPDWWCSLGKVHITCIIPI